MPHIYVAVSKELKKQVQALAAERGMTESAFVKQLVFEAHQAYLARKGVRK